MLARVHCLVLRRGCVAAAVVVWREESRARAKEEPMLMLAVELQARTGTYCPSGRFRGVAGAAPLKEQLQLNWREGRQDQRKESEQLPSPLYVAVLVEGGQGVALPVSGSASFEMG